MIYMKVLCVNCSMRGESNTIKLVKIAMDAAKKAGAQVELLDLREKPLPIYHPDDEPAKEVEGIRKKIIEADALIVGSPEYHGSVSGTAKNFFDHFYEEFSGRLIGLVSATGGSQGVSAITHMRAVCQYVHAWTLPYQAAAKEADFDGNGNLTNQKVRARLENLGRDVVAYGRLTHEQFRKDLKSKAGFAEWHA